MAKKVIVIGGGPGGYPAAILAARAGFNVTLVEKDELGGACLQVGCIPSKILLDAAKRFEHFKAMGSVLTGPVPEYDYAKLIALSRERVAAITKNLGWLVKKSGTHVLKGTAMFNGYKSVLVSTGNGSHEALTADYIVIASGAGAKVFNFVPYPHERVWTNREALLSETKPEKLLVLGGGVIGCEFASFFNAIGVPVTIIEALPRILGTEDEAISVAMTKIFESKGVTVLRDQKAKSITADAHSVVVELENGERHEGSHLLVATGIAPATENLNLTEAGITLANGGFIPVSLPSYETNVPGIFAIGDAIAIPDRAHPGLAHVASAEAEAVVAAITGHAPEPIDYDNIPTSIFTIPEIAHVGLTESQARENLCQYECPHHTIAVQTVRYLNLGRSTALNLKDGFVKLIAHQDTWQSAPLRQIAGAHVIGENASEMIEVVAEARHAEDSLDHFKRLVFPHPTWSELWSECMKAFDDEAPHVPPESK